VVEEHIPADYKTSIYRIVQEAMNNAVKYAQAKTISIMLCRTGDDLQLNIQDNGVGFDPVSVVDMGMGLMSMRERAETLGGVFKLQSSSGQGVSISVLLPLEKVALNG
jgi:signal transduction histidine kinase